MRLLIVEDNEALSENLSELFVAEGFEVLCAKNGQEALQKAAQGFEIAILDLRLPDTTGTVLLQKLKEFAPDAEALLLTGDADVASAIAAVRAGAFAYLIKPVDIPELLLTTERAHEQVKLRLLSKELQAALKRSEQKHRTIVETVPALIIALDKADFIRLANHSVANVTGVSREDLLGRSFREVFGHGAEVIQAKRPEHEEKFINQQGQTRYILWRWTHSNQDEIEQDKRREDDFEPEALSSQPGAPYEQEENLFLTGTDVTELRRLERERNVSERLAVVGKMTAGLAHEIRNPLNAALLQLTLLSRRQEKLAPEIREAYQEPLSLVRVELERLSSLLTDFLSLARPREYQLTPVLLEELLNNVLALQTEVARQRGISLKLRSLGKLAVLGDKGALQQVFVNLIKNALEAAVSFVEVSAIAQEDRVIVSIEDDGSGISSEAAEHIFDPFFTTKPQGTGLGLAIVHFIVIAHGGEVNLSTKTNSPGVIASVSLRRG
jgi:PAS domain S-box-containing protein